MNAVYRNQKTCRKPLLLSNNWYAYVQNDPVGHVDLWGLTASDSTANKFHIGQNSSGASFVDSMITDPDYARYLSDQEKMAEIKKRFNQGINAASGFSSNNSACDEYTTKVMEGSGVKPENWPNPHDNYVGPDKGNPNYKDSLTNGKMTPNAGTNAVIMEGGTFSTDPHMVYILFNPYSNGDTITSTEFTTIDNETGKRGIITQTFENQDAFEANYGYDSFSYYGVDTL